MALSSRSSRPSAPRSPRSMPKKVVSWVEHPTKEHPYGQPPVIIEEFFKVGDIVKTDAGWRKAMKRRGLTDKDIADLSAYYAGTSSGEKK